MPLPTTHWFDAVPYDITGAELICYLDGPADHFRGGCGCGWRSQQAIMTAPGNHYMLPEADWGTAEAHWEREHYTPAVLAEYDRDRVAELASA